MTRSPSSRLLAWAVALAAAGCSGPVPVASKAADTAALDTVTLDSTALTHAGITVASVATALRAEQTDAPGIIALDERRTARIGSLVEGILLETHAEVGDHVRAGQVLATMHSPVVHEAWASYRKAIAERRRLEKELAFAVAAHERTRRLYAEKAISLQETQRAEADRVAAEETLDMGRTEVRRSEEELQHLGITNADDPTGESGEQIPIRAPSAGVVLQRFVTPGTAVTPGTPLYVVSDLSALWALVDIDESLLSHVRTGQPIRVHVAAYPDETFAGVVTLVGDTVNPKTHRVTVRCALPNPDRRLKPDMYASAAIRDTDSRRVVVIPEEAIQTINGRSSVFLAEAGGRFRPQAVDPGSAVDGMVEIRSGLTAGDHIAISGTFVLKSELLKATTPEG